MSRLFHCYFFVKHCIIIALLINSVSKQTEERAHSAAWTQWRNTCYGHDKPSLHVTPYKGKITTANQRSNQMSLITDDAFSCVYDMRHCLHKYPHVSEHCLHSIHQSSSVLQSSWWHPILFWVFLIQITLVYSRHASTHRQTYYSHICSIPYMVWNDFVFHRFEKTNEAAEEAFLKKNSFTLTAKQCVCVHIHTLIIYEQWANVSFSVAKMCNFRCQFSCCGSD